MGKRITAILMVFLLLLGACGSRPAGNPGNDVQATDNAQSGSQDEIRWKLEETKLPDADEVLKAVLPEGSSFYAVSHDMSGESVYRFVMMAEDSSAEGAQLGICIQKLPAPYTEWENYPVYLEETVGDGYAVQSIALREDGSVCMLVNKPEEQGSAYRLLWTQDSEVKTESISSNYLDKNFWEDIRIESYVDGSNNAYFMTDSGVQCFDETFGEKKDCISTGYVWQIAEPKGADGQVYLCGGNIEKKFSIYTMKSNEPVMKSDDAYMTFTDKVVFTGEAEGLLCNISGGIWHFDMKEGTIENVFSFWDKGYSFERVCAASLDAEGNLLMLMSAGDEYSLVKRVVDDTWQDKVTLELATMYTDPYLSRAVVDFNLQSDEYYIELRERGEDEWYEDYLATIKMEVSSGGGPDILTSSAIDFYAAAKKGFLRDLTQDFAGEQEGMLVNLEKYGLVDEARYIIPYSFSVETLTVSGEVVGDKESWTTWEMMEYLEAGGYERAVTRMESYELFCLLALRSSLIDWENGKCYMDSEEAIALLEFAGNYGKPDSMESCYKDVAEGRTFAVRDYIFGIPVVEPITESLFEGNAVYIGYPVDNPAWESGNIMFADGLSVNQSSKCPEGAIAFIKYLLSEEVQDAIARGEFGGITLPVREDALENAFRYAKERTDYAEGVIVSSGEFEYEQRYCSDEYLEEVRRVIQDARPETVYVEDVWNIIVEETEAFYQSEKSAEEVCSSMQQRLQLYFEEIK